MKQEHYIFGLIGIGAVAVLYILWKESQGHQTADASVIPVQASPQTYPNAQPIKLGDITINEGPTPSQQNYNVPIDGTNFSASETGNAHTECGCRDEDCDSAGTAVTVQSVPERVLQAAHSNLLSFLAKTPATVSGVELARVTFGAGSTVSDASHLGGAASAGSGKEVTFAA